MSTEIKLSESQLTEIIYSGEFLGKPLGNLVKEVLLDLVVPLAKDVLPKLASKTTSFVLDQFKRKISRKGAVRGGKGFTFFSSN